MRRRNVKNAKQRVEAHPELVILNPKDYKGKWNTLFKNNNPIYLDYDNLIVSGTENTQNTWMDAKYDGKPVTPRNGKAVEVNSLWYNANRIMQELTKKFGHPIIAKRYKKDAL